MRKLPEWLEDTLESPELIEKFGFSKFEIWVLRHPSPMTRFVDWLIETRFGDWVETHPAPAWWVTMVMYLISISISLYALIHAGAFAK